MGKALGERSLKQVLQPGVRYMSYRPPPLLSLEGRRILVIKDASSLRNPNEQTLKGVTWIIALGSLPFSFVWHSAPH